MKQEVPKSLKMLLRAVTTIGMKLNQHPLKIYKEKRYNKLSDFWTIKKPWTNKKTLMQELGQKM